MKKSVVLTWRFSSKSQPRAAPHETRLYEDGSTSCNCRGWTQRPNKQTGARSCKHTDWVTSGRADTYCDGGRLTGIPPAPDMPAARLYPGYFRNVTFAKVRPQTKGELARALISARGAAQPPPRSASSNPQAPTPCLSQRRLIDLDELPEE